MSNQWMQPDDDDYDDDDQAQQRQAPKGLRSQLDKVSKENKELRDANTKLLSQVRQTVISQVLTAKGIDSKVAKLVPADMEPTEEAIGAWLAEYNDLFAPKPAETPPAETPEDDSQAEVDEETNADLAAQMGRMSNVVNGAQAPGRQKDLLNQIASKDMTHEKLLELIQQHGGGIGSG